MSLMMTLLLLAIFCVLVSFAFLVKIKDTVSLRGYLHPSSGLTTVYPSVVGLFDSIHIKEGDSVRQGQVIALIKRARLDESGQDIGLDEIDLAQQQLLGIGQRIELLAGKNSTDNRRYSELRSGLEREADLQALEVRILEEQYGLARDLWMAEERLYKQGASSQSALRQSRAGLLNSERQLNGARLALERVESRILEMDFQENARTVDHENTMSELRAEEKAIELRIAVMRRDHAVPLISPIDGLATALVVSESDRALPSIPFVTIIPFERPHEGRLFAGHSAIGKLSVGQELTVTFDAYPAERYGRHKARITSISETLVNPLEYQIPVTTEKELSYLATVELEPEAGSYVGAERIDFRYGAQFTADVVTQSRTIIERIFSPLERFGGRL